MAHKIIAADLGSSSIKLSRFEASFRKAVLIDTRVIPFAGTPGMKAEERIAQQLALLAHTMNEEHYGAEELVLGLPGDALVFRLVDLPFANPKQIESVLSYELESLVLAPVEDLTIDFVIVGPRAEETRVLAAAAPKVLLASLLKTASDLQLPLRAITAAPLAYGLFLGAEAGPGTSLVVDIGHETTNVVLLRDGVPQLARTIGRGGRQVTEAIAAAFKLEEQAAEKAKIESGFVAHQGLTALSAGQARMDSAVRDSLKPLLRELRQTLASYRASYGEHVERLMLTGGGARLAGLAEFVTEELAIPTTPLPWLQREGWAEGAWIAERGDLLTAATGMALAAATQQPQLNFRKGEFAYKSDYSFLKARGLQMVAALAVVVLFAGLNAYVALRGLRREHDLLAARLKKATIEVFGSERTNASDISSEVKAGPKSGVQVPVPPMTAFDLLDEISKLAPPSNKIKLDITRLDIKPKKTVVEGTALTAQQVDDLSAALQKIECFEEVQKGKVQSVPMLVVPSDTPSSDSGGKGDRDKDKDKKDKDQPTEMKVFRIDVKGSCP